MHSKFDYANSEGETLSPLLPSRDFSFKLGYAHRITESFMAEASLLTVGYGAYGSDTLYGNSYRWEAEYLGLRLGATYEFYRKNGLFMGAHLAVSPQYMYRGQQAVNGQWTDLKGVEQFDSPYLFYGGGIGLSYCVQNNVAVRFRYHYSQGGRISTGGDTEQLQIMGSEISIGLQYALTQCQYCQGMRIR